eukprot:358823-Pelagomonas_calceolata.AAC.4
MNRYNACFTKPFLGVHQASVVTNGCLLRVLHSLKCPVLDGGSMRTLSGMRKQGSGQLEEPTSF